MHNNTQKNFASFIGTDEYRSKKIMQAPGGATSISLGYDNSNPFENRPQRYLKKVSNAPNNTNNSIYSQTHKIAQDKFFTGGAPFATNSDFNQFDKSTITNLRDSRNYGSPKTYEIDNSHNNNFNELLQKSLRDPPSFKSQISSHEPQSPMENAYLKHKVSDAGFKAYANDSETIKGFSFQSAPSNDVSARSIRSRSQIGQVSSLQNNYKNILNDFSPSRSDMRQSYQSSYSSQCPTTNDFAESKSQWSGKKIVQPPGGGSSLKLWG